MVTDIPRAMLCLTSITEWPSARGLHFVASNFGGPLCTPTAIPILPDLQLPMLNPSESRLNLVHE